MEAENWSASMTSAKGWTISDNWLANKAAFSSSDLAQFPVACIRGKGGGVEVWKPKLHFVSHHKKPQEMEKNC